MGSIEVQLDDLVKFSSAKKGNLPTPTKTDANSTHHYKPGTKEKVYRLSGLAEKGLLPTPTARDWKDCGAPSEFKRNTPPLTAHLLSLPTPTTFDSGNPMPPRKKNPSGGQKPPLVSVIGGKLNPEFVEYLMGYPLGWSEIEKPE